MKPDWHLLGSLGRVLGYIQDMMGFSRPARLVLLSCLLISPGYAPFFVLYNLYLKRLGYSEDFIGDLTSVTALATMLTALAMGLLGDRVSRRWLFRIGVTMSGLGLAVRSANRRWLLRPGAPAYAARSPGEEAPREKAAAEWRPCLAREYRTAIHSFVYLLTIPFLLVGAGLYYGVFQQYERQGTAATR